jgi:hypothetical protein
MFNPLRRRKSSKPSQVSEDAVRDNKQHFQWFGQSAFKSLGKLIDNSLSTVSEQLIEHIQNASYDIDLNNARRETFINERYINQHRSFNKPQFLGSAPNLTQNSNPGNESDDLRKAEDIQKIKKALSEYREYKKSKTAQSPASHKKSPYQYNNESQDTMN